MKPQKEDDAIFIVYDVVFLLLVLFFDSIICFAQLQ